jgi:uncharacterized membrane protein
MTMSKPGKEIEVTPESPWNPAGQRARQRQGACALALTIQVLAVFVIIFGDIGFDRPGRFGLTFGHLLALLGIWFAATCAGFWLSWSQKCSSLFWLQCLVFTLIVCGGFAAMNWPVSRAAIPPDISQEAPDVR